jgi:hypothetical protein
MRISQGIDKMQFYQLEKNMFVSVTINDEGNRITGRGKIVRLNRFDGTAVVRAEDGTELEAFPEELQELRS